MDSPRGGRGGGIQIHAAGILDDGVLDAFEGGLSAVARREKVDEGYGWACWS